MGTNKKTTKKTTSESLGYLNQDSPLPAPQLNDTLLQKSAAEDTGSALPTDASQRAGLAYFLSCLQLPVVEAKFQVSAVRRWGLPSFYPDPILEKKAPLCVLHH